jgi:hypothetical protein
VNALDVVTYSEATDHDRIRAVPLSNLSIEVGHFYMEDLLNGEDRIRTHFQRVVPWIKAATDAVEAPGGKPRVSTCFLMDDYFHHDTNPAEVVTKLLRIADECDMRIDYLAREAGCCVADGVPVAEFTAARLLHEPAPGTNGSRPPAHESGWLCNGKRSTEPDSDQAMRTGQWQPPLEFGKRNHSIFLDVELWTETEEWVQGQKRTQRTWSCPFLASVWQLLRLGMLRNYGEPMAQPHPFPQGTEWPEHWGDLPAVMQLNARAAPFAAYRSVSILPHSYLPIEHAVRTILDHLSLDDAVTTQVVERAQQEGLAISRRATDRVSHVFIEGWPDARHAGPR